MSGEEFDAPALVRVMQNTDLRVVRAAIRELGLGGATVSRAAGAVLEELDDEIRLLRRYRTTQANSFNRLIGVIPTVLRRIEGIRDALANMLADPLGSLTTIKRNLASIVGDIGQMRSIHASGDKATRLAEEKLEDLVETRGKIAVLLA